MTETKGKEESEENDEAMKTRTAKMTLRRGEDDNGKGSPGEDDTCRRRGSASALTMVALPKQVEQYPSW